MMHENGNGPKSIEEHDEQAEERLREQEIDAEAAQTEAISALDRVSRMLEESARKWQANEPVPSSWDELFGGKP